MVNIVTDPLFTDPANSWGHVTNRASVANGTVAPAPAAQGSSFFVVSGPVATVKSSKYNTAVALDVAGKVGARPAGGSLTVSATVSAARPVTVELWQGSSIVGSTVQSMETPGNPSTVSFAVDKALLTGDPLLLRVYAPAPTTTSAQQTLILAAPAVEADAPPPPPPPEPKPDPEPEAPPMQSGDLVAALAPRVAAHIGAKETETSASVLPVVIEFVKGYTRDRGFGADGYSPEAPLQAVIISAASRLATNPEQVYQFQAGDYSERPAILNGFTLAELAVLNRYRRRSW